jgi:superfamily I DNA/RNA helicase
VVQLDEFSLRSFPPAQIGFAQIQDFKGLESLAVILLDLEPQHFDRTAPSMLYVGMSRAKAYLALVSR